MTLHRNIKAIRERQGMTQRDLSFKASGYLASIGAAERYMDRDVVSKIERGVRQISAMELKALSVALGCTLDELFSDHQGEPDMPPR